MSYTADSPSTSESCSSSPVASSAYEPKIEFNSASTQLEKYITKENLKEGDECDETPLEILGATDITGVIVFLVKFENSEKFMHASVANVKHPQLVIKFYESNYDFKI